VSGVVPFELSGLSDFISEVKIRRRISYMYSPTAIGWTLDIVYISDNVSAVVM
jgi:hypothetical protein